MQQQLYVGMYRFYIHWSVWFLMVQRYDVFAYCDNNKDINEFMGKKVFRPKQATVKYKDAVYIVANKLYGNDMKLQLETMGISFKNIKKYNTMIE